MKLLYLPIVLALLSASVQAGVAGAVVGGTVGGAIGKSVAQASMSPDVEAQLAKEVAKLNPQLPKMADSETRIDRVSSGPGRTFTYHHTMIHRTGQDIDTEFFNNSFAPGLKRNVCQQLKVMIQRGVTVVYSYTGRDGKPIISVVTTPQYCGQPSRP